MKIYPLEKCNSKQFRIGIMWIPLNFQYGGRVGVLKALEITPEKLLSQSAKSFVVSIVALIIVRMIVVGKNCGGQQVEN